MGLLENYKEQNPQAFKAAPQWQPSREYGFFIRFVMRLSRGKIQDVNTVSKILLVVVIAVVITATVIFFWGPSGGVAQPSKDLINRPQPSGGSVPR